MEFKFRIMESVQVEGELSHDLICRRRLRDENKKLNCDSSLGDVTAVNDENDSGTEKHRSRFDI